MKKINLIINVIMFNLLLSSCSILPTQSSILTSNETSNITTQLDENKYGTIFIDDNITNGIIYFMNYVSGSKVLLGTTVSIIVVPDSNYKLSTLTLNDVSIIESKSFVVNEEINYIVNATFETKKASVTLNQQDGGTISISNCSNLSDIPLNTTLNIKVECNTDYYLYDLKVNNTSIKNNYDSNNNIYLFSVTSEIEYIITPEYLKNSSDYSYLYGNTTIFPNRGLQSVSIDNYYESCKGLKGEELKQALHNIIDDHTALSYDGADPRFLKIDYDPNNPDNLYYCYEGSKGKESNVYQSGGFKYDNEHVWAKSHGNFGNKAPTGSDLHNLRPCRSYINSARGNNDFGEVSLKDGVSSFTDKDYYEDSIAGNYNVSGVFEPKDEYKGDIARIIFYMAVRYEGDNSEVDLEVGGTIDTTKYYKFTSKTNSNNPYHGDFQYLYKWATSGIDPVSDYEVNRNNIVDQNYQHNRNPFIDHPEFIIMIYDKNYSGPGALL